MERAAEPIQGDDGEHPSGAFESIKRLGKTLLEAVSTRIELLSAEIAEELAWLAELLLYAAGALLAIFMAVSMVVVFMIALLWDSPNRLQYFALIAAAFSALAIGLGVTLTIKARAHARLFSASIDQIALDIERLK